jgi:hypothetical protein
MPHQAIAAGLKGTVVVLRMIREVSAPAVTANTKWLI